MATRPNSSRSRTREAILDAAASAFREQGFAQTSMDEIARLAGVARGTLYYNFASKDDIAIGIAERARATGYARLLEQQAAGLPVLTLLDNFFDFAGDWIADNRDAAFIGTMAAARGVGRNPDRPGTTMVFEGLVAQGQDDGVFRKDVPAASIARLLSVLLTQAALQGAAASDADVAGWPRRLLHLALNGALAKREGGS